MQGHTMAFFDNVLVTKLTEEDRGLRFTLTMFGPTFEGFNTFQAFFKKHPDLDRNYFSNPLNVGFLNRQAILAFLHKPGSSGTSDTWQLMIEDVVAEKMFTISELGEVTLYDDGSTRPEGHD